MSDAADRNLLVGILACQLDFLRNDQLIEAMNAWIQNKEEPLERVLLRQNALSEDTCSLLMALVDKHLQLHDGNAAKSLASLSTIGSLGQQLCAVNDAAVELSLTLVPGAIPSAAADLSPEQLRAAGAICDQFEAAWQTGDPQLETYLKRWPHDNYRREVLENLILIELKHSKQPASESDYKTRFPDDGDAVAKAFRLFREDLPGATLPFSVSEVTVGEATSRGLRFKILRPHAKGGLGQVSVALDAELNREVALKEIQPNHADDGESRGRFVQEAEITGGLEHPGIVPVYGLGRTAAGRPFYAMRFVRGDSLREAIDRYHQSSRDAVGADDQQRSLEFRQLLGRFLDVCNAIEYAHSRGVLHRDLKPGNVMLGKYGETLVVDWGLAKVMGEGESARGADEPTLRPASGSGSAPTMMGRAIGTPAFMPPEQAAGKIDQLGPASDVYSLGATFYYLLTGRPPISSDSVAAVLQKAEAGDFPSPRSVVADAPKPLEAICLRAMAAKPEDRYASPRELAEDVERYLADEPVSAHQEPVLVRARRWARKHQTLTATTAASIVLSLVGVSVFAAILSSKNVQLTQARRTAVANELAAREQSRLALTTLSSVIREIQAGLEDVPGGGEIRRRLLAASLSKLEDVASRYAEQTLVDRDTMLALMQMGEVVLTFGVDESEDAAADPSQNSAVNIASKLMRRAHEIAKQLAADQPRNDIAKRELSVAYENIGRLEERLGDTEAARAAYEASLAIREKLAPRHATVDQAQRDLAVAYEIMGDMDLRRGESKAAQEWFRKSLAISATLAAKEPSNVQAQRDLSISHETIGDIAIELGDTEGALKAYNESLRISEEVAEANPQSPQAQGDLSILYIKIGDVQNALSDSDAALGLYEKSLAICRKLVADDPNNVEARRHQSVSYRSIGDLQLQLGDPQAAEDAYKECLAIREKLAADNPSDAQAQRDLSIALVNIGKMQLQADDLKSAGVSYKRCLDIRKRLASNDRSNAEAQDDLCIAHARMGDLHVRSGDLDAARDAYKESLTISQSLAAVDSDNAEAQSRLAAALDNMGDVALLAQDFDTALDWFELGLAVAEKLASLDPRNAEWQRDLSIAYSKVGDVQNSVGEAAAALASYKRVLQISSQLAAADPDNAQAQHNLMVMHYKLAQAHEASADYTAAVGSYKSAADILQQMIDRGMNVEANKQGLARVEQLAETAKRAAAALGDWESVLKQPAAALPELVALRGLKLSEHGKYVDAAQSVAKLRELDSASAEDFYNGACVYGRCASSIAADDGQPLSAELRKQREAWIADALATLKQAIEAGWNDLDHIQQDEDLAVLRDVPEFKALLQRPERN